MRWLPMVLLAAACGGGGTAEHADASPCMPVVMNVPLEPAMHIPNDNVPVYQANPPASGPHWAQWARWSRVYPTPIARGNWVHNLEHGGVVFLHDGTHGDELEAMTTTLPPEAGCTAPLLGRWLVTADPLLPPGVPVAAVSWGMAYTAGCVDVNSLRAFYLANVGHAPENTCAEGQVPDLTAPDAGAPEADGGTPDAAP